MKKLKIAGIIFFWLTLLSPMVAFMVACQIGEVDIFEIAGGDVVFCFDRYRFDNNRSKIEAMRTAL